MCESPVLFQLKSKRCLTSEDVKPSLVCSFVCSQAVATLAYCSDSPKMAATEFMQDTHNRFSISFTLTCTQGAPQWAYLHTMQVQYDLVPFDFPKAG